MNIKDVFKSNGVILMWCDVWDIMSVSNGDIIDECLQECARLKQCNDLTPLEDKFIKMVDSWE